MGLLVSILTFCIVIALFFAVWMLMRSGDNKQELVRRRMDAVRKAERRGDVSTTLKLARDEMLSSVPVIHRMMLHWAWSVRLQERISQAGLTMKAGKLVSASSIHNSPSPSSLGSALAPRRSGSSDIFVKSACGDSRSASPKLWTCWAARFVQVTPSLPAWK